MDECQPLALGDASGRYIGALQPTACALGAKLGVDSHVLDIFSEEIVRGSAVGAYTPSHFSSTRAHLFTV